MYYIFLFIQFLKLIYSNYYYLNETQWYFKEYTNETTKFSNYMKAKIPSTVHMDLLDNKIMPDPYFRDNLL